MNLMSPPITTQSYKPGTATTLQRQLVPHGKKIGMNSSPECVIVTMSKLILSLQKSFGVKMFGILSIHYPVISLKDYLILLKEMTGPLTMDCKAQTQMLRLFTLLLASATLTQKNIQTRINSASAQCRQPQLSVGR